MKLRPIPMALVMTICVLGWSQTALALPERVGQINDFAAAMSEATVTELESFLSAQRGSTGRDLLVLIVRNMEGMSVADYDSAITEAWGLDDRHVLILIAVQESAVHISTGDAVQGIYPDPLLQSVVNDMIPFLAEGRFDTAVSQAANRLVAFHTDAQSDQGFFSGPVRLLFLGGILAASLLLFLLFSA